MSRVRAGACAEPGPWDYHCTEPPLHRYSCYDAGEDTSWNERSPEDWQTETPHACYDEACDSLARRDDSPHGKDRQADHG